MFGAICIKTGRWFWICNAVDGRKVIFRICQNQQRAGLEQLLDAKHNAGSQNDFLVASDKPYAVIVPGCSSAKPQKRWPAEHFATVANDLFARGIMVYLVGTKEDRNAIDSVLADASSATDLCGKTNLTGLAKLMKGASYVIGNDTCPIFLAAKSGTPTLMIMGPDTDPTMSSPTGEVCQWLRGDPISSISSKAALDALYSPSWNANI